MLAGSQSILNKWKGLYSQALNIREVSDVRQNDIQTAAPLVPEPNAYDICMAIEPLKMHNSSGNAHIAAELNKAGDRIISYRIHNISNYIWDKEELPQQWKESIIVPIYEVWNFNSGNYLFTTDTK